jgi:hypothetical protein
MRRAITLLQHQNAAHESLVALKQAYKDYEPDGWYLLMFSHALFDANVAVSNYEFCMHLYNREWHQEELEVHRKQNPVRSIGNMLRLLAKLRQTPTSRPSRSSSSRHLSQK